MIYDSNIVEINCNPIKFNGIKFNRIFYEKRIRNKHYKKDTEEKIEDYFKQVLETIDGKCFNSIGIENNYEIFTTLSITCNKPAQSNFRDSFFGINKNKGELIFTHLSSRKEKQYLEKLKENKYIK